MATEVASPRTAATERVPEGTTLYYLGYEQLPNELIAYNDNGTCRCWSIVDGKKRDCFTHEEADRLFLKPIRDGQGPEVHPCSICGIAEDCVAELNAGEFCGCERKISYDRCQRIRRHNHRSNGLLFFWALCTFWAGRKVGHRQNGLNNQQQLAQTVSRAEQLLAEGQITREDGHTHPLGY